MSQAATAQPIALGRGEGEARWFLGALATIKSTAETTGGRVAVTENWAPRGHGSPLHVHHNEDEWFYVLSGELTFWVDGQVTRATEGSFVFGPRDVPHTFTVSSDEAHFLLVVRARRVRELPPRALRACPGANTSAPIRRTPLHSKK